MCDLAGVQIGALSRSSQTHLVSTECSGMRFALQQERAAALRALLLNQGVP